MGILFCLWDKPLWNMIHYFKKTLIINSENKLLKLLKVTATFIWISVRYIKMCNKGTYWVTEYTLAQHQTCWVREYTLAQHQKCWVREYTLAQQFTSKNIISNSRYFRSKGLWNTSWSLSTLFECSISEIIQELGHHNLLYSFSPFN